MLRKQWRALLRWLHLLPSDDEERGPEGGSDKRACAKDINFDRIDNLCPYQGSTDTEEKIGGLTAEPGRDFCDPAHRSANRDVQQKACDRIH
jgi:hypothetical protein